MCSLVEELLRKQISSEGILGFTPQLVHIRFIINFDDELKCDDVISSMIVTRAASHRWKKLRSVLTAKIFAHSSRNQDLNS